MVYKNIFHKKVWKIHVELAQKRLPKPFKRFGLGLFLDGSAVFRHGIVTQVEDVGDFFRAERKIRKHTDVELGLGQVGIGRF